MEGVDSDSRKSARASQALALRRVRMLGLLASALLVLSIVAGCLFRWMERTHYREWNSDEGISVLMSSVGGRLYQELTAADSPLIAKWTPAREWQRLIDP